jgi:RHS repeat-associated protein
MTQAVVNSYAYDPFGQILGQQESVTQPFKYVGQYGVMAEPNGLYYMRARYYDPTVGRFISEDPLGFGGGDVNLYAYVRNQPVNWIDPWGTTGFYFDGGGSPFVIDDNDAVYKLIQSAFGTATLTGVSANKPDPFHAAAANPLVKCEAIKGGKYFVIPSDSGGYALLLQAEGTFNGLSGIYEYIVPINRGLLFGSPILTHQTFIPNAPISGVPNNWGGTAPPFVTPGKPQA